MLGTHYPCSRAVNTDREHGRHFWTPVKYGPPRSAGAVVKDFIIIMATLRSRCGHYYFCPVVSSSSSSSIFFFSSLNLSHRRLDVYHTCTHSVAL